MLKFGTLVDWMNIWERFLFLKVFLFGPLGPVFSYIFLYVLKILAAQRSQKWPNYVEIWYNCRLDKYLRVLILFFENLP